MSKVYINYGDNNKETVNLPGPVNLSHTYGIKDNYIITFSGRTTDISTMVLSGNSISGITGLDNTELLVTSINMSNNNFLSLPSINNNLRHLYLNNAISGATTTVPNYSSSLLETLEIDNNNLSGYTSSTLPDTLYTFSADNNSINTTGVTNIINDMYNNSADKSGMTISMINNYYPLIDTTKKYDLVDYSGSTIDVTGRFQLEVYRSSAFEANEKFVISLEKPVTDHDVKIHADWDNGTTEDIIFSATTTTLSIGSYYSSGSTGMVYYPKIDAYFNDITYLSILESKNTTTGATLNIKEFPGLTYVYLPRYDIYVNPTQYYHCLWTGNLDLSRNNKLQKIVSSNHNFTSITWPSDVTNMNYIDINSCPVKSSPRIDLMSTLTYFNMGNTSMIGSLYSPSSSAITYYNISSNPSLTAGNIPDFTNNSSLVTLNMIQSNLNGIGNTIWSTLSSLEDLNTASNYNLVGTMPNLSNNIKLKSINMSQCGFTSIGSTNWDNLINLTSFYIDYNNNLIGLRPSFINSTGLTYYSINNGKLYGGFPDFTNNINLSTLSMNSNKLNYWKVIDDIIIQSDNKIILAGLFGYYNGTLCSNIIRLNNDGSVDSGFTLSINGFNDEVTKIKLQSDNKILCIGKFTSFSGNTCKYIARLNSDGTFDTGFTSGTGFNILPSNIGVQSNGNILVGGQFSSYNGTISYYFIVLNSNGTINTSYPSTSVGFNSTIYSINVQSNDKVFVAGDFTTYNSVSAYKVIKLNSGYTTDTSFSTESKLGGIVYKTKVQSDGKVLVGGNVTISNINAKLCRLNSDGTIDTTFLTGNTFDNNVYGIDIQSDGKIIVGGYFSSFSGTTVNGLVRLSTTGVLDNSYDIGNGFNNDYYYYRVSGLKIDNNNKLLVHGGFTGYSGSTASKIIRLNDSSTTIDTGFTNYANNNITPDFSNCTKLTSLSLNDCGITGFHSSFSKLTGLTSLELQYNNLHTFPDLSNQKSLRTIDLSYSSVDYFPSSFSGNTNMTSIIIGYSNLSGYLPLYLSNFTKLVTFRLPSNKLYGEIPESLATLSNIIYYDFDYNNFSTGITYFSGRTNLQYLYLGNNNFTGTTMPDISAWNGSPLSGVHLSYCGLNGQLIGFNTTAGTPITIYYDNNNFIGNIPPIFTNSSYSYYYNVSNNFFTGYTQMTGSSCYIYYMNASNNYLSDIEINKLVADVRKTTKTSGSLYINGTTMGKPTGQGLTDISYLINTMGWTVTYNT